MPLNYLRNLPIRKTLLFLALTATLFFAVSSARLVMERMENARCQGVARESRVCSPSRSVPDLLLKTALNDFALMTRLAFELGLIVLAIQLTQRLRSRLAKS